MRSFLILLFLSAFVWVGLPFAQHLGIGKDAAAYANGGSSNDDDDGRDDDDDDDDDDDESGNGGPGSGNSGPGSSGSGSPGSGGTNSGSSGSSAAPSTPPGAGEATARPNGGFGAESITIQFADGHAERIRDGRFESIDARGRIVTAHAARRSDVNRLKTLGSGAKRRGGSRGVVAVVEIDDRGNAVEITDNRGWREVISGGTYLVKDPDGRTVVRRPVTLADIRRIRASLGLD